MLTRYEVKRIRVFPAVRVAFFLSWTFGFLLAGIYGVLYLFAFRFHPESFEAQLEQTGVGPNGPLFVVAGGLLLSIATAFAGATAVWVLTVGYNALSRVAGGVEVELRPAMTTEVGRTVSAEPDAPDVRDGEV